MITIIEKTIEGKKIICEVDEKIAYNKLGGLPILKIGNEIAVIYPVDTLTVIKGIANSETLANLVESLTGSWAENQVTEIIRKNGDACVY